MNSAKRKGDRAELEVQRMLQDELGMGRRALGAGRKDDVGDIHGLNDCVIQVANYADLSRAVREKLPETERQRQTAGVSFAALFARRYGGSFVVVQTVPMWCALYREAIQ